MKRLQERNPTGSAKEVGLREIGLLIELGEMILLLLKLKTGLTIELLSSKWGNLYQVPVMTTIPLMQ